VRASTWRSPSETGEQERERTYDSRILAQEKTLLVAAKLKTTRPSGEHYSRTATAARKQIGERTQAKTAAHEEENQPGKKKNTRHKGRRAPRHTKEIETGKHSCLRDQPTQI
jgi:hypothetical protein